MKKRCLVVFLVIGLLSVYSAVGQNDIGVIDSVEVHGNVSMTDAVILAKVRSRAGQAFDASTAAEDADRIAKLGGVSYSYYNTVVVDGKIKLTFVVVERNIVRSLVIDGNQKIKDKKLRKKLDLKLGDYLDPVLAETGTKAILDFYHKKGYAFAQVSLDKQLMTSGELVYTIDEGPRVKIAKVVFSGNKGLKTKALKKVVKSKKRKFWILRRYFRQENFTQDLVKLQSVYYDRGYLDAKITARQEFNKNKDKIHITFEIDEGPVYTIESIIVTGNRHFDVAELREKLKTKRGLVYSENKANSDIKALTKVHREIGFIDAKVEQRREFISDSKVNVLYELTEGERFRIGQINITGNQETHDNVVRRILDEYDFQPGKWYNADTARGNGTGYLEKLIRRSTLMEATTITSEGKKTGQRDARVNIIEGQTGSIMLGAGIASDSGAIGQLVFEQRNFDIHDKPESFKELLTGKAFKGAGQNLRIALQPGTIVSTYSINFTEPYLNNKPVSLDIAGSSFERWRDGYDEGRTKGYFGLEKRYKNRWRKSIGFRAENIDVDNIDSDAPKEITDVEGDNVLFGIKLGVRKDMVDDKFNPSKGYIFSSSYEQVGGDHTFGILSATHRYYRTLHENLAEQKTVLGTKLYGATIVGDAPLFEKFYVGGSQSMRGFDYRGISPRAGIDKDPVGSDWIVLANTEVTVPLTSENFAALFFVDTGLIDTGGLRVAPGIGIQILIPQWFGPVPMRFELSAPMLKDDDDETRVFSFSVGRLF